MKLILIGGLPGTGKSTLAALLAARYRLPLLAKDTIKEALLDSLQGPERPSSRSLSDAAFAIQFRLAAACVGTSRGMILEGNFRPAEHREPVAALLRHDCLPALIQVLCRLDEPERRRRLEERRQRGLRHPAHQDLSVPVLEDRTADDFIELPGLRLTYTGGDSAGLMEAFDALVLAEDQRSAAVTAGPPVTGLARPK